MTPLESTTPLYGLALGLMIGAVVGYTLGIRKVEQLLKKMTEEMRVNRNEQVSGTTDKKE